MIEEFAALQDRPASEPLAAFREAGSAFWWRLRGDGVTASPDTGLTGDRAQRVEVDGSTDGNAGL